MNIERMLKILELSQRGVAGEAENASTLLNRLLKQNNMSIDDLLNNVDTKKDYSFYFDNKRESRLFSQVACFALQVNLFKCKWHKKYCVLSLNNADYLMIDYLYTVYKRDLKREVDLLKVRHRNENKAILPAFFIKNELYFELSDEKRPKSKKSSIDFSSVQRLANDIKASNVKKPINNQPLELDYKR